MPLRWSAFFVLAVGVATAAQQAGVDRQPRDVLDATPPSARVAGAPGAMTIQQRECRGFPAAAIRQRIVQLAVQEWGFFGFAVVDRTDVEDEEGDRREWRGRRRRGGDAGSARVASSIAGYWAVTPDGAWILQSQNAIWNRPDGATSRWRYAWSAAFVSWVMCESGLAPAQFRRAIAHHTYIDQAIRARDAGAESRAAYAAYDAGEVVVAPGDLLCTARRPAYRSLAERRRQMDQGARTHCDIVVDVDEAAGRYFAIGGNVRASVSLKVIPAVHDRGRMRPADESEGGRTIFAHLSLRAAAVGANAFASSPTMRAVGCGGLSARAPVIAGMMRASGECAVALN
jgi:hypothetical protein